MIPRRSAREPDMFWNSERRCTCDRRRRHPIGERVEHVQVHLLLHGLGMLSDPRSWNAMSKVGGSEGPSLGVGVVFRTSTC